MAEPSRSFGERWSIPAPVSALRSRLLGWRRLDQPLADFCAITLMADRAFPSVELLGWFDSILA